MSVSDLDGHDFRDEERRRLERRQDGDPGVGPFTCLFCGQPFDEPDLDSDDHWVSSCCKEPMELE